MRRFAAVAAISVVSMWLGGPVSARPPAGSAETCTRSFVAVTLEELLERAQNRGVPEQAARDVFASVNKNADAWICEKHLPGRPVNHFNFVDTQAVGHAGR